MTRHSLSRNDAGGPVEPRTPTNKKTKNTLHDTPLISSRFVKRYVGLKDDTTVKDPKKFMLHDGVWQEWAPGRFRRFIEYIQTHLDLVPFARQEGIPVGEVQEVFSQSIIQDLYAVDAAACARLNARMKKNMKELIEKGEKLKTWGKDSVPGFLFKVHMGHIELYGANEEEIRMKPAELTESDLKYLRAALLDHDWERLSMDMDEVRRSMAETADVEMTG